MKMRIITRRHDRTDIKVTMQEMWAECGNPNARFMFPCGATCSLKDAVFGPSYELTAQDMVINEFA